MFDIGIQELIMIFVVALIVVGPKRLPEIGRTLGKGLAEMKRSFDGVREQVTAEMEMVHKEKIIDAMINLPPESRAGGDTGMSEVPAKSIKIQKEELSA